MGFYCLVVGLYSSESSEIRPFFFCWGCWVGLGFVEMIGDLSSSLSSKMFRFFCCWVPIRGLDFGGWGIDCCDSGEVFA